MPSKKLRSWALRCTKPCRFDLTGECVKGVACNFAHGEEAVRLLASTVGTRSGCKVSHRLVKAYREHLNGSQVLASAQEVDELPIGHSLSDPQGHNFLTNSSFQDLNADQNVALESLKQAIFSSSDEDEELAVIHSVSENLHHSRALETRISKFLELEVGEFPSSKVADQTATSWDELPMGHSVSENHNGTYGRNVYLEFAAQGTQKAADYVESVQKERDDLRARELGATLKNTFLHFDSEETGPHKLRRSGSAHGRLVPDDHHEGHNIAKNLAFMGRLEDDGCAAPLQVAPLTRRQVLARTAILGPALGYPPILGAATQRHSLAHQPR